MKKSQIRIWKYYINNCLSQQLLVLLSYLQMNLRMEVGRVCVWSLQPMSKSCWRQKLLGVLLTTSLKIHEVTFFTFLWFATINYCNFYKLFYSWHLILAIRHLTSKFTSLWQLILASLYSTLKRNKIRNFATSFLRQFLSIKWSYFHYSQHCIQTKRNDSGQPLWAPTKMSPKNYQAGFFYIYINF